MKNFISFRALITFVFVGSLIPLLVAVGLLVFRLQQSYLLDLAQRHLTDFVQAGVQQYAQDGDLTQLAVNLSEDLRVLGADMFIQNAAGEPVPPSLGRGPWLDAWEHQAARDTRQSRMQMLDEGPAARIVYLATVVDSSGQVLGTVEASLPLPVITEQLDGLRRWLTIIITLASFFMVLLAGLLSSLITRPLTSLVTAVESARLGSEGRRAPVSQVREVGRLAETYNRMLDRLTGEFDNQTRLADNMRRFAANASHELRSPLSVFRNSVDLLEKAVQQKDIEQQRAILDIQRKEVGTMTGLVENLLLLARLDQSAEMVASILHPEEVHPLPLLEEVYERSRLLAKGQQVDLVWPTGELCSIWADRAMVRRALNNLVENAITYTPAGKKITLKLETHNDGCAFVIEDQGVGISPEQLPRLTERFYRVDESHNRRIPGTGLGLSIVDAIMRAHGGALLIESQPGQGSCFRLVFGSAPPGLRPAAAG
jgi:two-component system OmpR family sensor kinase